MNSKSIQNEFSQKFSTFQFILLSIVSFNFALYNFILKYVNKTASDDKKRVLTIITYVSFGLFAWSYAITGIAFGELDSIQLTREIYDTLMIVSGLFSLCSFLCVLGISIVTRKSLQDKMNENNLSISIKLIWCVLIPIFYQYYIIYNSDEISEKNKIRNDNKNIKITEDKNKDKNDKYTELEKLSKLKEAGIISEEEFCEQKKKILS